jgi:hypothetical protein
VTTGASRMHSLNPNLGHYAPGAERIRSTVMLLFGPTRSPLGVRQLFLPFAAVVAILAIGVDVAQWLRGAPLWVDEEMIALNLRDRTFSELSGPLWLGQAAPLGWMFVERAAILTFGTGELSLRLPPLLFGIGTIAAALWAGARWLNPLSTMLLVTLVSIGQWMSHYRFEVKHYSADAFFAFLLPALAVWAAEVDELEQGRWRWTRWWIVAALAQWLAYGALFVTPACALLLAGLILRRHGMRAAMHFSIAGVVWLLSLGAHYALSLQYTHHSRYLRGYWSGDVPPASMSFLGILGWIAERLDELASNPGGTTLALALWIAVAAGFALGHRRILAAMFALVPLSAFVLAALRLVPLTDRLALWIVPALYVGLAMLFDAGLRNLSSAWTSRSLLRVGIGVIALPAALYVGADIVAEGRRNLDVGTPGDSNHAFDDRTAVRWLMDRRQPGDVIMTTRLGWPAVRWYGGISVRRNAGGTLPDGSVMLEVSHEGPESACRDQLRAALDGRRRVLVHLGFPDIPMGFYELLLYKLSAFGTVVESARFQAVSRVAVVELHVPSSTLDPPAPGAENGAHPPLDGCIGVRTARRW